MSFRRPSWSLPCLMLALVLGVITPSARAQSSVTAAFTHQGELKFNNVPVNGPKDMRFRLYDAATGGNQIGTTLQASALPVIQGKYTVQFDFGANAFNGQARWLEIDVSNGPSGEPFTTLSPRQPVTVVPYAAYALNANTEIQCSTTTSFSIDDRVGWTRIEDLGDDTCFNNLPLGFTFTGWGRTDTTVSVSSNGLLFFGDVCVTNYLNQLLPTPLFNSPCLAFFWDDLRDDGANNFIEYSTLGSPGGRVFYLYFRNRLFTASCGADVVNIVVSIHEGTNMINIAYSGLSTCALIRGSSATIGLQGPGGFNAKAFMLGFNAPILDDNASRQTISFTPPRR